ncbi:hypothetical protein Tco_0044836 [Tanacetum coccineum]
MDHYTMKALWIYWIRGDDEVELTDEKSSDDKDEVAEVFRIDTNLFNFETPIPMKIKRMIGSMNGTRTYHGSMRSHRLTLEFGQNPHQLNILVSLSTITGCSEWPTCSWMDDVYCNGGNLPRTYIIGNPTTNNQGITVYEALEDSELKDEALRNKAIMEGFINKGDDESRYEQERRWNIDTNYDDAYEDNEKEESCEVHKLTDVQYNGRYMMKQIYRSIMMKSIDLL